MNSKKESMKQSIEYLQKAKELLDKFPDCWQLTDSITEVEEALYYEVGELEE